MRSTKIQSPLQLYGLHFRNRIIRFNLIVMIPSLLLLLWHRYQKNHPEKGPQLTRHLYLLLRIVLLLVIMTGVTLYAFSQERVLQYTIKRGGSPVGSLVVKESKADNEITYKLQSAVKTSFLFTITVKALEEAVYQNGILTYSRFYQKVNSNERVNTEIQANGKMYVLIDKQEAKPLNRYPITYNMVCLYTIEPLHHTRIFADKYQQFVPIENPKPHQYKITFPDGNYNEYYYQAGICTHVEFNSTWFSAEMELKH